VVLIVLSGLPGTGKSAIADAAMLRSGIQRSFATGLAAYAVASTIAEAIFLRGQGVIVDAVNGVAEAKAWWPALAGRAGARLAVVECRCSDPAVHRQRLESRARGIDGFPEPSWAEVVDRAAE
jgi:predicted kinase